MQIIEFNLLMSHNGKRNKKVFVSKSHEDLTLNQIMTIKEAYELIEEIGSYISIKKGYTKRHNYTDKLKKHFSLYDKKSWKNKK